ncbi:glycoside hydrolase family 25 [Clostridium sp. SHJSY1]|uniref:GH25 family lysozyme n=1 Tax=Clostridium sp. SHJSY1 TaxID=2942483 RepID=UPI002875A181|nr:GH25 family lysozyme [Clostridium sp. SHJSY1]MDS0527164.1 glycoside hydrolase family 25 [Clostridium sp. SHJSY1]
MKKRIILFTIIIIAIIGIVAILAYFGVWWPTRFFVSKYEVKGIDVSNYQKDVNWEKVAENKKIKFAYIKATEGMDYQDKYFQKNWEGASKTQLYRGAYHYFTITSSGEDQAKNFTNLVPAEEGCLPPVVDIEEKGLDKDQFKRELKDFIRVLEEKYKQKPIIYTVHPLYDEYIKGDFEEYPIWIRDIVKPPKLSDGREWIIWQYSSRDRIDGIDTYVDVNVLQGELCKLIEN